MEQTLQALVGYLEGPIGVLMACALNFAFPFVSQLRANAFHFTHQHRLISNTLAGISTATVVLVLFVERHSLHETLAGLPQWPWLVIAGVLGICIHLGLVEFHKTLVHDRIDAEAAAGPTAMRAFGLVLYVASFAALCLGFNRPLIEKVILVPVSGEVACQGVDQAMLEHQRAQIATSPVVDGRYRFLLHREEIRRNLKVYVKGTKEERLNVVASTLNPQLDIDFHCAPDALPHVASGG